MKNVAVIGVGAVGVEIIRILKQRKFPVGKLRSVLVLHFVPLV